MNQKITPHSQSIGGNLATGRTYVSKKNNKIQNPNLQQQELESQQEALRQSLIESQEKGEAAGTALGQIIDLIDSVRVGISANTSHDAPVANSRLLASAAATVADIADYTSANGRAVFDHIATAQGPHARNAINAYNANQRAFAHAKPTNEPTEFRHALAMAKTSVSGQNGVVRKLNTMAESGPQTGPEAEHQLQQLSDTLSRVRDRINETTSQDIAEALAIFNTDEEANPLSVAM